MEKDTPTQKAKLCIFCNIYGINGSGSPPPRQRLSVNACLLLEISGIYSVWTGYANCYWKILLSFWFTLVCPLLHQQATLVKYCFSIPYQTGGFFWLAVGWMCKLKVDCKIVNRRLVAMYLQVFAWKLCNKYYIYHKIESIW